MSYFKHCEGHAVACFATPAQERRDLLYDVSAGLNLPAPYWSPMPLSRFAADSSRRPTACS
jgi:hypothetical protein